MQAGTGAASQQARTGSGAASLRSGRVEPQAMTAQLTTPRRLTLETTDPREADEYLKSLFGSVRTSGAQPGDRFYHSRIDAGGFALDHCQLPRRLRFDVDPLGVLVIGAMAGGCAERRCAGREERIGPRDVFIGSYPDMDARITTYDLDDHFAAVLGLSLLAQVASADAPRRPAPIRFTGLCAFSPAAARQWRSTYGYVDLTLGNLGAARQPLIVGAAGRLLAAAALATFPNTALVDPTAQDRRDAAAPTLRRAIAFIEERAGDDLSVADIAAAAAVTIRAVQLAFRRHLDTTPMAYLRQVRLDRAHQDLLRSDPGAETVAAVAARWGFTSHSKFTAVYRRTYGVPPSHTLRRG
jgi:AraC-like DNA-binding protein